MTINPMTINPMTYHDAITERLRQAHNEGAALLGQINSYRFPGWGLDDFPVCESLMNACGIGIALTGRTCIVSHDRMDFIACGLDPILNFAAIHEKAGDLPLVLRVCIGHGRGQGPQHAKNLSHVFEGIPIYDAESPEDIVLMLDRAIRSRKLCVFIERREFDNYIVHAA